MIMVPREIPHASSARRFVAALYVLAAVAPSVASCTRTTGPRIWVPQMSVDLGRLTRGQKVTHRFDYHNQGDGLLAIGRPEAACACTVLPGASREVPPNGSGMLAVQVDTSGLAEGRVTGLRIVLKTNDSRRPEVVLTMSAFVESEFHLSTDAVHFGDERRGAAVREAVRIDVAPSSEARLLEVRSSDPAVEAKLEALPGVSRRSSLLILRVAPDAANRSHFGVVSVSTTSPYMPQLRLPVSGGNLALTPRKTDLRR